MDNAAWGDEAGSTVTFKLPMSTVLGGSHAEKRNPFHQYTKRRKGRSGTRFYMAVTTSESAPKMIYKDEAMLAGWNDSQQKGHTVKFWLCNDGMGHPFEGVSRTTELALAIAELDDDNEPIDQKMRDRVEKQHNTGVQKPSNVAAMLCRTATFWEFTQGIPLAIHPGATDDDSAKQWIYQELGIESRAELDNNAQLEQQFELKIRQPYQVWYLANYGDPF
jgi:hypothetical protein